MYSFYPEDDEVEDKLLPELKEFLDSVTLPEVYVNWVIATHLDEAAPTSQLVRPCRDYRSDSPTAVYRGVLKIYSHNDGQGAHTVVKDKEGNVLKTFADDTNWQVY